jgi:plasmid stabilization system protein ParE
VNYALHPEAALEHEEQVAYYEARSTGLGRRYHAAFRSAVLRACDGPHRSRTVQSPGIRRVSLRGFPYSLIFREVDGVVQVLAVAPHRKRPGYWTARI